MRKQRLKKAMWRPAKAPSNCCANFFILLASERAKTQASCLLQQE
jgi:hypothetical protein